MTPEENAAAHSGASTRPAGLHRLLRGARGLLGPGAPEEATAAGRIVGASVAYVVLVDLVREFRPAVLFGPDLSWVVVWAAMWVATLGVPVLAGLAASRAVGLLSRSRLGSASAVPLPFGKGTVAGLLALGIAAGTCLRFARLGEAPLWLFGDDVTLIGPALELTGGWRDFLSPLRAAPYGVPKPYGTVGVLYLELFRESLRWFGTTLEGLRFPAALAASVSLATGALVGRALLPKGGGTLTALVLAGLRWHLIMSRWGWNAVVLIPLLDVATLLLLRARRRRSLVLAAAAGLACGLGGHVYLAAWVGAAALGLLALWPDEEGTPTRFRLAAAALFSAGFLAVVAPLLLVRSPGQPPYFSRAGSHNVLREMRYQRSVFPPFAAAADGLASPWFVPEPTPWADLPERSRLGPFLGAAFAVGGLTSLLRPRRLLSGLLLSHALAALLSSVAHGQCSNPNGYRYAYLAIPASVGIAAGLLQALGAVPEARRRTFAVAVVGLVAVNGVIGARDAYRWTEARSTYRQFGGCDTLLGAAAARWSSHGDVTIERVPGYDLRVADAAHRYRIVTPDAAGAGPRAAGGTSFAVLLDGARGLREGEKSVETITDPWGGPCGVVVFERLPGPATPGR